ncbi:MAG: hypothetical protein EOP15_00460 [Pseudomonas sp.]|nr:MAG: hypothetical protein EOP15_00460 [Pseudomonas sp.]
MNLDNPESTANQETAVVTLWGDMGDLNNLWRTLPPSAQSMHVAEQLTEGVWQTKLTRFHKIELIRTGVLWTEAHLYRRDETLVRVLTSPGIEAKQIVTVNGVQPLTGRLKVSVKHEESWLRYNAATGGELTLEWAGSARYYFLDPDYIDEVPAGYEAYFEQLKKLTIGFFPPVNNELLQQLYIYVQVTKATQWPIATQWTIHFSVSRQPIVYATITPASYEASGNEAQAKSYVTALFPPSYFPEAAAGRAPAEAQWLQQLVAPPGLLKVVGGQTSAGGWITLYGTGTLAVEDDPAPSVNANVDSLSPLARILSAGATKERLEFVGTPLSWATWTLAGEARGRLEKEGNDYFYVPPLVLAPAASFNTSSDMVIAAAYRTSIDGLPLSVDAVQAANVLQRAAATFVTTFVKPTHFIRFSSASGNLQLNLCWMTRTGERQVPANMVKWHVLAGNGVVSAQGVFSPASRRPSAVTILMAEDLQDITEWRFGVIIVPLPLFTVPDLLRLQQV